MTENQESRAVLEAAIRSQDEFSQAYPSQGLLEDVSTDVLQDDYRPHILLRSDRDNFYIAFSDNSSNLEPNEDGFLPNAHIKKISVMNGPRRTGSVIKDWIDATREAEREPK